MKTKIVSGVIMNEEKKRILQFTHAKFMKEGFYKVSMDELASELRMSKKTIYKHFSSKEELVEAGVDMFLKEIKQNVDNIFSAESNAIMKLINFLIFIGQTFSKASEKAIMELQKYMPHIWKKIDEFRTSLITRNFTALINQGKEEGLFIDKPTEIILTVYISSIRAIVNPEFLINNKFTPKQAFEYTFDILLNGVSTSKGKKVFTNIISRID